MSASGVPFAFAAAAAALAAVLAAGIVWLRANRQIHGYRRLASAITKASSDLNDISKKRDSARQEFERINKETSQLQALKASASTLGAYVRAAKTQAGQCKVLLESQTRQMEERQKELDELLSALDLYSRLDEYTKSGHFEMPDYLYETAERFQVEIKAVRDKQKALIREKQAVVYPDSIEIRGDKAFDKRVLNGQINLLIATFNIKCDFLVGKVNPSNYARTLEQIEKQANVLEKSVADFNCGFSSDYVELKFQECRLQYQYKLRKQEEQEEQRLIREQMREEDRARREYEAAVRKAEEEEHVYQEMLERARRQLAIATEDERKVAEARIAELEAQLEAAEARGERAKSLAEQTRRGHVYVISNIGSFGKDVYKIGLTRRLDPMERVKELGDASVPFIFDVHAIVYSDDAPEMESELHRRFAQHRVNAVNLRKEFFRVDLRQIRKAVEEISGGEADFRMTVAAEEYFETRRLQESVANKSLSGVLRQSLLRSQRTPAGSSLSDA